MRILYFLIIALIIAGCAEEKIREVKIEEKEPIAKEVKSIVFYTKVEVIDKNQPPNIVVSKDELDFGRLPQGMSERKEILLENNKDVYVQVSSDVNGSISKWIFFDKDKILISPKSNSAQIVILKVPANATLGNYTGYVIFTIYEVK